jgi:hypothetical protein
LVAGVAMESLPPFAGMLTDCSRTVRDASFSSGVV